MHAWWLFLLLLGTGRVRADYWFPARFDEENIRAQWDRGCPDWPEQIPGYTADSKDDLQLNTLKEKGVIRILARVHVRPERGESQAKLMGQLEQILTEGSTYKHWVMPGINEHPDGGTYFVNVENLEGIEIQRRERYILNGGYFFKILWFEARGISSILYRRELLAPPACPVFAGLKQATRLIYRMTPRPGLLDLLMAEGWLVPASDGGIDFRIRLTTKPANIVYQLMPERMVRSQMGLRGRRIFENFLDYRRLGKVPKAK